MERGHGGAQRQRVVDRCANRQLASSGFLGSAQYRAEHGNAGKAIFHPAER
jgi:hypothetical protein